jgi:hypothetical protein
VKVWPTYEGDHEWAFVDTENLLEILQTCWFYTRPPLHKAISSPCVCGFLFATQVGSSYEQTA